MSHYPYKTRQVRDLAWACFSPALFDSEKLADDGHNISNCGLDLTATRQSWLEQLDRQPAALLEHLKVLHNGRLGLYFESLWHFFLQRDAEVELIAHNLPIRDGGRTIGEFDCLYYCRQREQHFHLELAVKYYLSQRLTTTTQGASHWSEWLGPANTDNLDRKINHLIHHQILLADHHAAREALQELGISTLGREIEIKGYLFASRGDPLAAPYAHNQLNKLCHWLTIAQLPDYLCSLGSKTYLALPKPLWLAPARAHSGYKELMKRAATIDFLTEYFQRENRPLLLAALDESGIESQRFFVTGAAWPRCTPSI